MNIQSEAKRHTKPKPHNQQGTSQFNGLAVIFQLLSEVVPPQYFDRLFGGSTLGGLLVFAYWYWSNVYSQFPSESIAFPNYVIPAIAVVLLGMFYFSVRTEAQCPNCDTAFALRRTEREVERDHFSNEADDLLVRREEWCTRCSFENEDEFWRKDPDQRSPGQ
ncbi:hypothetical protein [Halobacterium noricense]|uniref:hypothetical protein n=1 Tax=Halobacterium noricense TaxID=223182 RepID=UPI001E35134A|nr:hypothetical protein [Halobacterium noricense]UHH26472.1 hypothetical protein LT974_05920 [Halobacterium noricense]